MPDFRQSEVQNWIIRMLVLFWAPPQRVGGQALQPRFIALNGQ